MGFDIVIVRKVAEQLVDSWLDRKRVFPSVKETYKEQIDLLVESVMYGVIVINEDNTILHNLIWPFEGEQPLKEIKYKARLNAAMMEANLKGIKSGEGDARMIAYISTLTDQPKAIVKAMDPGDSKISNAIVLFFVG